MNLEASRSVVAEQFKIIRGAGGFQSVGHHEMLQNHQKGKPIHPYNLAVLILVASFVAGCIVSVVAGWAVYRMFQLIAAERKKLKEQKLHKKLNRI